MYVQCYSATLKIYFYQNGGLTRRSSQGVVVPFVDRARPKAQLMAADVFTTYSQLNKSRSAQIFL